MKKRMLTMLLSCGITVFTAQLHAGGDKASLGPKKAPLTLKYIANCGVMISSGSAKVLIDALFDKPADGYYRAPDPADLEKILNGEAPFDGIDLALVTHNHPDHFDAGLAVRFLEGNPRARLLAPTDAVVEIKKNASDWKKIEKRVLAPEIAAGNKMEQKIGPIQVTAMCTLHSGGEQPLNYMYLLDIAGRRVFHEGDSVGKPEAFSGFGLSETHIDLALVHFWFPLNPDCAKFLQEILKVDHIGLTHLPIRLESDTPAKIDMVRQYYKDIFLLLPGIPEKTF